MLHVKAMPQWASAPRSGRAESWLDALPDWIGMCKGRITIFDSCQPQIICLFSRSFVNNQFLKTFCVTLCLPAPLPSQTENTQAAQPEESRSEGKVGFKAYKNYFAAGASWVFIVFLILLNMAAQVLNDVCALNVIVTHIHFCMILSGFTLRYTVSWGAT